MKSLRIILQSFDYVPNTVGQPPVWIEAKFETAAGFDKFIFDWNHKPAVRAFAALADPCVRGFYKITTQRLGQLPA